MHLFSVKFKVRLHILLASSVLTPTFNQVYFETYNTYSLMRWLIAPIVLTIASQRGWSLKRNGFGSDLFDISLLIPRY